MHGVPVGQCRRDRCSRCAVGSDFSPSCSVKRVLSAPNAPEAHVAVALLENAGIDAVVRGEHMGAMPLGPASRPSVWVRDEDYESACKVLGVEPESSASANEAKSPVRLLVIGIIVLLLLLLLRA